MKTKRAITVVGVLSIVCVLASAPAFGQATIKQNVYKLGAGFTQATVVNAETGLAGIDIFAGKMLTNNLLVGVNVGYDIVSFAKKEDTYERLTMIPIQVKAKYMLNVAPRMQAYVSAAGGVYRALPHLGTEPVGGIWWASNQPGGSIGLGLDYWFLLINGVGLAFDYHILNSDGDDLFTYFTVRVDYCLIKF